MSWITTLYETYENIIKQGSKDLLPIAHSTQNAHIEVTLNSNSEMIGAEFVDKDNASTLIPVTEASASRTSGNAPHPLCDKLQYLAGDYEQYTGKKKEFYDEYIKQLKDWCQSEHSNNKVKIIYNYLVKGKLISDLVRLGIMIVDESGKLTSKFNAENSKLSAGGQADAFIRFRVVTQESFNDAVWQDKEVINDYISYYLSKQKDKRFCYTKGEIIPYSNNHPSKIRHTGDKAKLISSNDTSNFTFKGRFHTAEEAMTLSYEVSQKAHNALKWLISNQGQRIGDKVFVLWGTQSQKTPAYLSDTMDFAEAFFIDFANDQDKDITRKGLAEQFNNAIRGYKDEITPNAKLALIGLDAPTTGRMSIIFYREYNGLEGHELIDNIKSWHKTVSWQHRYKFKDKKPVSFYGAPSCQTIATIAYGTEQGNSIKADDKIVSNAVERIQPCIVDGRKIPRDIAKKLIDKAKQPQNYESIHNWYKVLTVCCAVYRKYLYDYKKEEYSMEVKQTDNLAYNCGRLLAVADAIESWALRDKGSEGSIRTTNAIRYFTRFSTSPAKTWAIINNKLIPYKQTLGIKGSKLYKLIGEISGMIDPEEFKNASNLDGCMVLGFDTQRQALINQSKENKVNKINEEE
ncbi:MAG: type I-C CRISPR-associated protein Cas8c/Csd1 [Eubacteriales bacterium]|nr:type I-C CRISPR-associated protein Cas8c/Csd1 [Eubacteriales bacterium]